MSFRYPKLGDAMTKPPKKGSNLRKSGVPAAGGRGDKKRQRQMPPLAAENFSFTTRQEAATSRIALRKKPVCG